MSIALEEKMAALTEEKRDGINKRRRTRRDNSPSS
jgi:hypothetical protein